MINEASTITVMASALETVNKRVTSTVAMNTERLWLACKCFLCIRWEMRCGRLFFFATCNKWNSWGVTFTYRDVALWTYSTWIIKDVLFCRVAGWDVYTVCTWRMPSPMKSSPESSAGNKKKNHFSENKWNGRCCKPFQKQQYTFLFFWYFWDHNRDFMLCSTLRRQIKLHWITEGIANTE